MSIREILEVVGAIFAAGVIYTRMQSNIDKAKGDVNEIGKKLGRTIAMLAHPAWSDTDDKRAQLAKLIEPKW